MYHIEQIAWLKWGRRRSILDKNLLTILAPTADCLSNPNSLANLSSLRSPLFMGPNVKLGCHEKHQA